MGMASTQTTNAASTQASGAKHLSLPTASKASAERSSSRSSSLTKARSVVELCGASNDVCDISNRLQDLSTRIETITRTLAKEQVSTKDSALGDLLERLMAFADGEHKTAKYMTTDGRVIIVGPKYIGDVFKGRDGSSFQGISAVGDEAKRTKGGVTVTCSDGRLLHMYPRHLDPAFGAVTPRSNDSATDTGATGAKGFTLSISEAAMNADYNSLDMAGIEEKTGLRFLLQALDHPNSIVNQAPVPTLGYLSRSNL